MKKLIVSAATLLTLAACTPTTGGHAPASTPAAPSTSSQMPSSDVAAPTPSLMYTVPTTSDFTVTLKILSKQCFGEAGCNITYRPQLAMDLSGDDLDPSVTYDVTYVVKGGDSGPVTDTLTVNGGQYDAPDTQLISTASQSTKLTVKVTDVEAE